MNIIDRPRINRIRRLARPCGRAQGAQLWPGRDRQFGHRLQRFFPGLLLSWVADHRRQYAGLDGRGHRLLCDEFDDHLRRGIRPQAGRFDDYFSFVLSQVAGFFANTATVFAWRRMSCRSGPPSLGHRRELRGQLLAVAFRGVPPGKKPGGETASLGLIRPSSLANSGLSRENT